MKKGRIGIVKEAYSVWERRAPFTPTQVSTIVNRYGIDVHIQPSTKRVFKDKEYVAAGATITDDLSTCNSIFGVKQVPMENLIPDKTYLFFSHTIKAQLENMPLMDELINKNCRLIDYECITRNGLYGAPRLVAFGQYAGRAGMINSLRGLGTQLLHKGISTPFLNVGSAYMYPSYHDAGLAVKRAGQEYWNDNAGEIPTAFNPLVMLFTGTGQVNKGAREVFQMMPHKWVDPDELQSYVDSGDTSVPIIGCQVEAQHIVERLDGKPFNKTEYYEAPELYKSVFFERYARHANCLVNGIYWDPRYPRVLSKDDLARGPEVKSRLHFIADISCDIAGGIEAFHRSTTVEDPFLNVEDPPEAKGITIMGVDILPSELPREASAHFGDYLLPYVKTLSQVTETKDLPVELQGATIVDQGELTNKFLYIDLMRQEKLRELNNVDDGEQTQLQMEGSTVIRAEGHLFDTKLINEILDVVEEQEGRFHIIECLVGPQSTSSILLQITMDGGRPQLDDVLAKIQDVVNDQRFAAGQGSVTEMPPTVCMGNYRSTLKQSVTIGTNKRGNKDGNHDDISWVPLKTVTVLGAGMVAGPCVEYLSRDTSCNVVVCSVIASEAYQISSKIGRTNIEPMSLNAANEPEALEKVIARSDTVISLLPQTMHVPVAKLCIQHKVPLVTASYVSPEMEALNQKAKDNGVPIICEMGLDPGMDHMSAMMVIDEMKASGMEIKSFKSVCGGLPAPEAANNPFGYKFSWSPLGFLMAMNNNAKFLKDGQTISVSGGADLLDAAVPFRVHQLPSLALEELPNRDSTIYGKAYGILEAETCFRGTLRYQGFSEIFAELIRAGFTSSDTSLNDAFKSLSENVEQDHSSRKAVEWLFDQPMEIHDQEPALLSFARQLENRLAMQPGERDLCVMQHTFNGGERVSTLLSYGNDTDTAMARTVGLTAAVGAKLLVESPMRGSHLHGLSGVLVPTTKQIYEPCLEMLEKEGIKFTHH